MFFAALFIMVPSATLLMAPSLRKKKSAAASLWVLHTVQWWTSSEASQSGISLNILLCTMMIFSYNSFTLKPALRLTYYYLITVVYLHIQVTQSNIHLESWSCPPDDCKSTVLLLLYCCLLFTPPFSSGLISTTPASLCSPFGTEHSVHWVYQSFFAACSYLLLYKQKSFMP